MKSPCRSGSRVTHTRRVLPAPGCSVEFLEGRRLFATTSVYGNGYWTSEDAYTAQGVSASESNNFIVASSGGSVNESKTLTLSGLPEHTRVNLSYIIGWEGGQPWDDSDTVAVSFAGQSRQHVSGPDAEPEFNGGDFSVPHEGGSVTVVFTASGWESHNGEYWYIDGIGVSVSLPDVSISGGGSVTEGDVGTFTVSRDYDPNLIDAALDVNLEYSGDAESPEDFDELPTTVTIEPGQLSKSFSLTTIDDDLWEDEETVVAALAPGRYRRPPGSSPTAEGKIAQSWLSLSVWGVDGSYDRETNTLTIKRPRMGVEFGELNVAVKTMSNKVIRNGIVDAESDDLGNSPQWMPGAGGALKCRIPIDPTHETGDFSITIIGKKSVNDSPLNWLKKTVKVKVID